MNKTRLVLGLLALLAIGFFFALRSSTPASDGPGPLAARADASATTATVASRPALAPATATGIVPRAVATSTRPASSKPVFTAKWGSAPGQLGRREANESNPESPAALAVDGQDVVVLDQVNGRVQRFRGGVPIASFEASETVQDVALAPGGRTVLLDRLADKSITIVGADGKVISEVAVEGKGIEDASDTTGVFADEDGVYVEREHGSLVKVADSSGTADPQRPELPGRPTKDGKRTVTAAIADQAAGRAILTAFDRVTMEIAFAVTFEFSRPLLQLLMLDSDRAGNVYVGAEGARERADHTPYDAALMVMRFSPTGAITGLLELPAGQGGDEMVRPLAIDDDGALVVMQPGPEGMVVSRHQFR